MRRLTAIASCALLLSCTEAQLQRLSEVQADATSYHAAIASTCAGLMIVAPLSPILSPWIIGGCATEAAIAKLALDPSSLDWLRDLSAKVRGKL